MPPKHQTFNWHRCTWEQTERRSRTECDWLRGTYIEIITLSPCVPVRFVFAVNRSSVISRSPLTTQRCFYFSSQTLSAAEWSCVTPTAEDMLSKPGSYWKSHTNTNTGDVTSVQMQKYTLSVTENVKSYAYKIHKQTQTLKLKQAQFTKLQTPTLTECTLFQTFVTNSHTQIYSITQNSQQEGIKRCNSSSLPFT